MMSGNGQGGKWDLREHGGLRDDACPPYDHFLGSYAFFCRHSDMK